MLLYYILAGLSLRDAQRYLLPGRVLGSGLIGVLPSSIYQEGVFGGSCVVGNIRGLRL